MGERGVQMSDNRFAVVFAGQLVEGARPEQVKANFAQLFKVDMARIEPMFGGKPVTIKKGVDEATAKKYQQALLQAGAVCQVVDLAAPQAAAPSTPAARPAEVPAAPAPAAAPAAAAEPATGVTALNATLAEPGVTLIEPAQVQAAQIETDHLSMGAVGETLVEAEHVPDLQVDLSQLSMAEAGVQLIPPSSIEAPAIDVSQLSMAEPGVILKEPEEVPPAKIDTSKISLA